MRPSASKAGLLADCTWWARKGATWDSSTSLSAYLGIRFHACIDEYIKTGAMPSFDAGEDADIEQKLQHATAWVDAKTSRLSGATIESEVAFAWDPVLDSTTRITSVGRDYTGHDNELCGTADVFILHGRSAYIGDWKTGDGSTAGPQLEALAMMASRAYDLDEVTVEALEVDDVMGITPRCVERLYAWEFAVTARGLREALSRVETSLPTPGAHCTRRYCPALATCPATRAVLTQITPHENAVHSWGLSIESPDHAAWLYERARAVSRAADDVTRAVRAYLPPDGAELSDGSRLVAATRHVVRTDHAAVRALALRHGATDAELVECTRAVVESAGIRVRARAPEAAPRRPRRV